MKDLDWLDLHILDTTYSAGGVRFGISWWAARADTLLMLWRHDHVAYVLYMWAKGMKSDRAADFRRTVANNR